MKTQKTVSFVLRNIEYKESSYITTFFTPTGCVDCVVRGARRKKNKFSGLMQKHNYLEIQYVAKDKARLATLTEASLLKQYAGLLSCYEKLAALQFLTEVLYNFVKFNEETEKLFENYRDILNELEILDNSRKILNIMVWFIIYLLKNEGHLPAFSSGCFNCGRAAADFFVISQNRGLVCNTCAVGLEIGEHKLYTGDVKLLCKLENMSVKKAVNFKISHNIFRILLEYMENILEKKIKSGELFNADWN